MPFVQSKVNLFTPYGEFVKGLVPLFLALFQSFVVTERLRIVRKRSGEENEF